MKVESISIQNFKLFEDLNVSFKDKTLDEVRKRFLILGDNATGKTSLLQAIALPLALATGQARSIADFDWVGFVSGRYSRWGDPKIELVVSFCEEEIEATCKVARTWSKATNQTRFVEPGKERLVRLVLKGRDWYTEPEASKYQFMGRSYAGYLAKIGSDRSIFGSLPGMFYFDQFRNLGTRLLSPDGTRLLSPDEPEERGRVSFEFGVSRLREYLIKWSRRKPGKNINYLEQLENSYRRIFPDRSFKGPERNPGSTGAGRHDYFLLHDGKRSYDIEEMSAGEQAIFPILYEFVRRQIAHSVILIDEIDLNLHPPLAQELVVQLPKIGPTCQFIFTTHSSAVSDLIGEDQTFRLPGGKLCL